MNVRKPVDYSAMFAVLDTLMATDLPQMELYCEIGRLVSGRTEKGAAVAAAEYLCVAYPDASGFSPRNLRRMREFYRTYESVPEVLAEAMTIGWTQNVVILEAELSIQERAWYIRAAGQFGWSKLELSKKIQEHVHETRSLDSTADPCYSNSRITAEYMSQMEAASQLTASGLKGDYRLLADFNDVVLAGHPTKYGVQFVTWARIQEGTALDQGHYYGPSVGKDSYTAAKQDFAVRSGLIPRSALFTPEQLTEVYRCIQETLENSYPITDERQKCLQSTAEQIERSVPDLDGRVTLSNQKELESALEDGGMHFC